MYRGCPDHRCRSGWSVPRNTRIPRHGTSPDSPLPATRCTLVVSGDAGRPQETSKGKEAIVAPVLFSMNLASDILAIAVAAISLLETAARRRSDRGQ
jgi:hypothetical protein